MSKTKETFAMKWRKQIPSGTHWLRRNERKKYDEMEGWWVCFHELFRRRRRKKRYFLPDVPRPHELAIHQDKLRRPPAAVRNAHWLAPQYKVPQCSAHWHWLLLLLLLLPCVAVSSLPACLLACRTESFKHWTRQSWWPGGTHQRTTRGPHSVPSTPSSSRLIRVQHEGKETPAAVCCEV